MLHERASNASELRAALDVLHDSRACKPRATRRGGDDPLRGHRASGGFAHPRLDGTAAAAEELALCRAATVIRAVAGRLAGAADPVRASRADGRALWDWKTTPPLAWVADVEAAHGAVRRELRAVLAEAGAGDASGAALRTRTS